MATNPNATKELCSRDEELAWIQFKSEPITELLRGLQLALIKSNSPVASSAYGSLRIP
jgi:hypothetical protein